ncbi:MAG: hypothetical protein Q9210_005252 [Variospora velana]
MVTNKTSRADFQPLTGFSLSSPALESIIEHLVLAVDLPKAVRLRLVCRSFDAEVLRAIFVTGLFNFETHITFRNVRPEYIRMWLVASTLRPNLVDSTSNAAHPHRIIARDFKILFDAFKGNSKFSSPAKHLLPAAAAVGDGETVRRLLRQKADPYEQSSLFGYAYRNAARRGDRDLLFLILDSCADLEVGSPLARHRKATLKDAAAEALIEACRTGKRPIVDYLLSLPPDALSSHTDFRIALEAAAGGGHISLFEPLLQHIKLSEHKWIMSP